MTSSSAEVQNKKHILLNKLINIFTLKTLNKHNV